MKSIVLYTDPAHGWAKVSLSELFNLEIHDKISTYSYIRSNEKHSYAYLEEDCDLSLYLKALDDKGIKFRIIEKHTDKSSKIRSYKRYTLGINYKNPFYNSDLPIEVKSNLL
jgi:hypothetical protein